MDVTEALARTPYPGRALLVARHAADGLCLVYLLTGRSSASRERVLVADGEELLVRPTGPQAADPLRHYRAVRRAAGYLIAGNGEHVDQLAALVDDNVAPHDALWRLRPEPDALGTARIAAIVDLSGGEILVGAARALPGPDGFDHVTLRVGDVPTGWGCLIATYAGAPDAPSVDARPAWVEVGGSLDDGVASAWSVLDPRFRVAVAGRAVAPVAPWVIVGGGNG